MSIAQRLEVLFAQTAGPQGRPVSMQEISRRVEERGITAISVSYLHQLRTGQAENPRLQHLRALADVFGVPLSFFFEEDLGVLGEGKLTPQELMLVTRLHGLSDESLASVSTIIELARKSERLDDPPRT